MTPELVPVSEIAKRLRVRRESVSRWAALRDDFPPVAYGCIEGHDRLWEWEAVKMWADEQLMEWI